MLYSHFRYTFKYSLAILFGNLIFSLFELLRTNLLARSEKMHYKLKMLMRLPILFVFIWLAACGVVDSPTPDPTNNPTVNSEQTNFVVSATGKVVPADWATISSPIPGIIVNLEVSENQLVVEGDNLLQLSGIEQISAMKIGAKLEFLLAQQALDEFLDNVPLITTQAEQTLANSKDNLKLAETTLNYLINGAKQSTIDQAEANKILRFDQLKKAQENFEKYEDKPKDDLVRASLQAILGQAQADYDNAERYYNNLNSSSNEIDLAQGKANLAFALAHVNQAQTEFEKVQDGPDPSTLELLQSRLDFAQAQLIAIQTNIEDLHIVAPFSGTISQIFVRQNEWANPGQPVLIIGDLNNLQIETTDLNEIDVARIKIGQKGIVTFDALNGIEISAIVIDISSKASSGTGVNYKVTLALDEIPDNLYWDMTAFIDIQVD